MRPTKVVLAFLSISCFACAGAKTTPGAPVASDPPKGQPLPSPAWLADAVMYEAYTRSFADSDGDGMGDLPGITGHLDHLRGAPDSLGVDALWLTPIHPTDSDHGYDVKDYDHVAANLGGDAAFDALLAEAHKRGLKILLDGVFNHSSSRHPWFVASQDPNSPMRERYVWMDSDPVWPGLWGGSSWRRGSSGYYYGLFDNSMPDLNYRSPATQDAIRQVVMGWLARGVDGFRLDAARYLVENGPDGLADQPETHAFWKSLRAEMVARYPEAVLIGEAWADAPTEEKYAGDGNELNAAFAFDLQSALSDGILGEHPAKIHEALAALAAAPPAFLAPFLSNHDQKRFAAFVKGDKAATFLGAKLLFALPGPVVVYYGEELGMQGGKQQSDAAERTPMQWTSTANAGFSSAKPYRAVAGDAATTNVQAESVDPGSLLATYRQLIRARKSRTVLRTGSLTLLDVPAPLLAFARGDGKDAVLCVFNLSASATTHASLKWPGTIANGTSLTDLAHPERPALTPSGSTVELDIGPRGGSWIAIPN